MKLFSNLGAKIKAHKLISAIAALALATAIGAGCWFGWQQYQYRQTSAFALEKLKQALSPPDAAAIAKLTDFTSLGADLAKAAATSFPFFLQGPDQERNLSHTIQTALLKRFLEPEKGSMFPDDETPEAKLQKPLSLFPPDFIAQAVAGLAVRESGPGTALVTTSIKHPQLERTFTLAMEMRKTAAGWKLTHVANANELAAQLREAMLNRHIALRNVFLDKNAQLAKTMNQLLPVQSCTADAGALSDGKTTVLIVHALARNRGDVQINNFNLDATIVGHSGRVLAHRFLNAAKPVAPGEDFNHRWSMELETASPLGQALLRDGPLQCRASWQTLSLNNGRVLHIAEVPNPDRACAIEGHNHPDGFCLSPVFQR
ncbi:MAG: translation initiation factor IF-2 [Desulfovibrio sp.]|nr:translation initiation factor IF-2 [Desulfovibrio sp.]